MVSNQRKKQKVMMESILSLGTNSAHSHQGSAWAKSHKINETTELTPLQQWKEFNRIQGHTRALGSKLDKRYSPTELISNPPGPEDVTLELLMASQTHMGHNTSRWNPANSRYIYGVREGIHIISLETTAAHLRRAARVVEDVAYRGGLILIVGTRKGQMEIVTKSAALAGACHVFNKWTPGAITNRDVILKTARTKVVDQKDEELGDFDLYSNTARPLLPDLVICLNPKENYTLLYECGLKSIPTIGVIDTDADPSWVTYTIPANDDSLRSVGVIAGVLGRAGERGQKHRQAVSKDGKVPWMTSPELSRHISSEVRKAKQKRKDVMGRFQLNVEGFSEDEENILRSQYAREDVTVSEDAMLELLGETAVAEAADESADPSDLAPILGDIEASLKGVHTAASRIEAHLGAGQNQ